MTTTLGFIGFSGILALQVEAATPVGPVIPLSPLGLPDATTGQLLIFLTTTVGILINLYREDRNHKWEAKERERIAANLAATVLATSADLVTKQATIAEESLKAAQLLARELAIEVKETSAALAAAHKKLQDETVEAAKKLAAALAQKVLDTSKALIDHPTPAQERMLVAAEAIHAELVRNTQLGLIQQEELKRNTQLALEQAEELKHNTQLALEQAEELKRNSLLTIEAKDASHAAQEEANHVNAKIGATNDRITDLTIATQATLETVVMQTAPGKPGIPVPLHNALDKAVERAVDNAKAKP